MKVSLKQDRNELENNCLHGGYVSLAHVLFDSNERLQHQTTPDILLGVTVCDDCS